MSTAFAQEVLETLRKNGSDITKPHTFEFYLYVPKEILATKVANKIRQSGFTAEVSRSGKRWECVASKTLVPATADLGDEARFFEQIAAAVGGEFDGWETALIES